MVQALARRGPDSEGFESWPDAVLGHRRLAILDLSEAGHQPMLLEDRQVGLVFNGCIYNFLELRKELESLGHSFRSNCDTEVLLRGFVQWGIDALVRRLRGMFAFAFWDNRSRRLTLVRDPLGVKPLLYSARDGHIAFASTITALRAADLVHEIDPQAVLEFLEFGYITEERTVFREAAKVPPGTIVEWQDGRMSQRSYWFLPEPADSPRISFGEAVEETERLLLDAVRLRLYADVPIGTLLSGGIDSALVCWATSKLNANVRAFTVSTPGDSADEAPAAVETARIIGIPYEIVTLPQEQSTLLEELTDAYGEPFGCSSALAMMQVSRAVKSLATVLLTGDGGDDVFLGYPFHYHFWLAQRSARFLPVSFGALWRGMRPVFSISPALRRPMHFLDYATGGLGAVTRTHDGLPYYQQRDMLGERLATLELPQRNIPLSNTSARRLLFDVLQYEQTMRFSGEFLTKVDGGTMYYAVEARSPLLDQKLWEFAATLPPSIRLRGGVLKAVLREIVRKNIGSQVASRKKRGFTVPVERWLATRWSDALKQMSDGSMLASEGWIRPAALRDSINSGLRGGQVSTQLWYLLVFEQWLQRQARPAGHSLRAEVV